MSASGLHACEAVYPGRHVAIVAGIGLQFKEYGQRPRRLAGIVEQCSKAVEELSSGLGRRCRRLGGPFEPFDGQRRLAAALVDAAQRGRRLETLFGRRTAVCSEATASSSMPISRYVRASVMCCAEKSASDSASVRMRANA